MHTVYIHIDEDLDEKGMRSLQQAMSGVDYINDVEVNAKTPHDMLVEFEEEHITPMAILRELQRQGVHADIVSA